MLTVTNNKETSVCTVFVRCVNTLNLLFRLDKNLEENTFLSSISNNGEMYAQYVLRLFVTSCSVAHQAPLSKEFSRQEDRSGLPFPPLGDLPDPGVKPTSLVSSALADRFFTSEPPGKPMMRYCLVAQSCPTLGPHELQCARLLCPSLSSGVCSNLCLLSQ